MISRRQMLSGSVATAVALAMPRARAHIGPRGSQSPAIVQLPAGMNLSAGGAGTTSYEGLPIYKNRIRECKGFLEVGSSSTLTTVSSSGWPTTDFQVLLTTGTYVSTRGEWASGTWKCGFIGAGTPAGINGATASNIGSSGSYTTFDLTGVGTNGGFKVTGTSGGATNVFAYLPAYPAEAIDNMLSASAFTNEAIAAYSKAGYIRAMDWTNCIQNAVTMTSSNRATPSNTQCFYQNVGISSPTEGVPLEVVAAFCMACNVPAWLNLPNLFDGTFTYITNLADALYSLVPVGFPIYLELSDELWNGEGAGITAWSSAATTYGGTNVPVPYYAYQHHNIASIFQGVFGARYGTDIRLVSAWQTTGNGVAFREHIRQAYATNGWSVSNDFYASSIAPYFNTGYTSGEYSNTIAQIEATLTTVSAAQPMASNMESIVVLGLKDGLSHICYEGGWQTNAENSGLINGGAAAQDSGMAAVMEGYYQAGVNSGSHGIPQWAGVDINTDTNLTPINEFYDDWTTFTTSGAPRLTAVETANAGPYTPTRNVVSGSGSVIHGYNWIDNNDGSTLATLGTTGFTSPSWSPNYGTSYQASFVVNCTKAGTYTLVANCTNSGGSSGATGLEWGGEKNPYQTSGSVSIPTGTGNTTLGTVTLVEGANYVCLTGNGSAQSTVAINTLTFN
jgi:hypothetical protein